jgi:hypothetical protein
MLGLPRIAEQGAEAAGWHRCQLRASSRCTQLLKVIAQYDAEQHEQAEGEDEESSIVESLKITTREMMSSAIGLPTSKPLRENWRECESVHWFI